jgi:hypothetical protein
VKFEPGQILPYVEMSMEEKSSLQRGMNFRLGGTYSVLLMSRRPNAIYADHVEDDGRTLIYEGHDVPRTGGIRDPKRHDQPEFGPSGKPTENGKFYAAAKRHAEKKEPAELVRVYEKLHKGIWVYNGTFALVDAWREKAHGRYVFKFRLELTDAETQSAKKQVAKHIEHSRMIPTHVKLEVWKRDKGQCVECHSMDNLHFDHIIPYSKGGTSLKAENIQLLCARHNLQKHDKIV